MKLTWDDFYAICQAQKPNCFKLPDWDKVETAVAMKLAVQPGELLHAKMVEMKSRYTKQIAAMRSRTSVQRDAPCKEVVFDSDDFDLSTVVAHEVLRKKQKKSLDQLGERQLKARTEEIWTKVEEYAEENNETPLRILALLLKKFKDKSARTFGDSVLQRPGSSSTTGHSSSTITVAAAMAIMVDCQLGQKTYSKLRKTLKQQGHDILPPWINLKKTQTSISPKPQPLPDPYKGVQMEYAESVQITAQRIMENLPPSIVPTSAVMNIKFGFDGSGSHAIYRQLENTKTNNIIRSMFCPLSINADRGEVIWTQKSPNSALTHRPLALQLGKESRETLESLQVFDNDINKMKADGFTTVVGEKLVSVKVNVASYMMDIKAANLYLGLGGAYCDLCDHSRADCHDPEVVRAGFEITRTVEDLYSLFEKVANDDGVVVKHRNDYDTRKGLTNKPIPNHEVISVQVLHALLRTFDHYMKIAVHLKAEVFEWTVGYLPLPSIPCGCQKGNSTETGRSLRREMGFPRWNW